MRLHEAVSWLLFPWVWRRRRRRRSTVLDSRCHDCLSAASSIVLPTCMYRHCSPTVYCKLPCSVCTDVTRTHCRAFIPVVGSMQNANRNNQSWFYAHKYDIIDDFACLKVKARGVRVFRLAKLLSGRIELVIRTEAILGIVCVSVEDFAPRQKISTSLWITRNAGQAIFMQNVCGSPLVPRTADVVANDKLITGSRIDSSTVLITRLGSLSESLCYNSLSWLSSPPSK